MTPFSNESIADFEQSNVSWVSSDVYLSFTVSSNSNFEHTEQNQQEVIKVIDELIKEAIAVVAVANEHACTLWFILLDKNEKVHIKEVTDGYGNKV